MTTIDFLGKTFLTFSVNILEIVLYKLKKQIGTLYLCISIFKAAKNRSSKPFVIFFISRKKCILHILGVNVRNMKMDLNIYGTWHRVTFEKLMMQIYDFFIQLSCLVTPYNIV